MKLEYDKTVDATYIYLKYPINNGEVSKTIELSENMAIDFDDKDKIIGIEILEASKVLVKNVLIEAQSS